MNSVVSFTVNVQGIGPDLVKTPEVDLVGRLSHGRYAYRAGLPRLLDTFKRHAVAATFFWPSSEALRVQGLVDRCLTEGHEVASHGRAFEDLEKLDPGTEYAVLKEAHETLTQICGKAPTGFRAPSSVSTSTFRILSEMGYRYDSSNVDDDAPYSRAKEVPLGPASKPIEAAKGMVELPWAFGLQDAFHFQDLTFADRCKAFMLDALNALLSDSGWACISLHPRADMGIARQAEIPILDELISTARRRGADIQLCRDVAAQVLQPGGRVIWNARERS